MTKLDPKNLIIEAKKGNAEAFGQLYELYFTPVFRYLYARTWNTELSEDIAQTTFIKAYSGIARWRDMDKNPLAYFFTIARNALHDHWQAQHHVTVEDAELERLSGTTETQEADLDHSLSRELLERSMRDLSDDQREVLSMKYFGELEYSEIAEATGKTEDSVRQLHFRALKHVKAKLQGI
jgi:RNA polymerase sigma-70 factor (ECF subfamily)